MKKIIVRKNIPTRVAGVSNENPDWELCLDGNPSDEKSIVVGEIDLERYFPEKLLQLVETFIANGDDVSELTERDCVEAVREYFVEMRSAIEEGETTPHDPGYGVENLLTHVFSCGHSFAVNGDLEDVTGYSASEAMA